MISACSHTLSVIHLDHRHLKTSKNWAQGTMFKTPRSCSFQAGKGKLYKLDVPNHVDLARIPECQSTMVLHPRSDIGHVALAASKILKQNGQVVMETKGKGFHVAVQAIAAMYNLLCKSKEKERCFFEVLVYMDDYVLRGGHPIGEFLIAFVLTRCDDAVLTDAFGPDEQFVFPQVFKVNPFMDPQEIRHFVENAISDEKPTALDCIGAKSNLAALRGIAYTRASLIEKGHDMSMVPKFRESYAEEKRTMIPGIRFTLQIRTPLV